MKPVDIWNRIFATGEAPKPESLLAEGNQPSEWDVIMLAGPLPNLNRKWICHRKRFYLRRDRVCGTNLVFGRTRFGWFDPRRTSWLPDLAGSALLLDYEEDPRNGIIMSRVRDYVRTTPDPDLLLGRFYYRGRFISYFSLARRKGKPSNEV